MPDSAVFLRTSVLPRTSVLRRACVSLRASVSLRAFVLLRAFAVLGASLLLAVRPSPGTAGPPADAHPPRETPGAGTATPVRWPDLDADTGPDDSTETWNSLLSVPGDTMKVAPGDTVSVESLRRAVVTIRCRDGRGQVLRTNNGVLLEQGLLVPYSALEGAVAVEAEGWDGGRWSADRLAALHPDADLALLAVDSIPDFALAEPEDASFLPGSKVRILRGPEGKGPEVVSTKVRGKFTTGGLDFLAVDKGLEAASPAFESRGHWIGVCFLHPEEHGDLAYLATTASVHNLIESRGDPVPLASLVRPPVRDLDGTSGLAFRGAALAAAGRTEEARALLDLAIQKDPDESLTRFWMGKILFGEGRFEEAEAEFARAGETAGSPEAAHDAWLLAGAADDRTGRHGEAVEMYRRAIEAEPGSAIAYCNLGAAHLSQLDYDEAEVAFRQAIALDDHYAPAYYNLALLLVQEGRSSEAEEVYQRLLPLHPSWAARLRGLLAG
jgi:Tfp pilus assembly protein PilF